MSKRVSTSSAKSFSQGPATRQMTKPLGRMKTVIVQKKCQRCEVGNHRPASLHHRQELEIISLSNCRNFSTFRKAVPFQKRPITATHLPNRQPLGTKLGWPKCPPALLHVKLVKFGMAVCSSAKRLVDYEGCLSSWDSSTATIPYI